MSIRKILAAALCLLSFTPALLQAEWRPGLLGGFVEGGFNTTDDPAETAVVLDPQAATNSTTLWAEQRTWVYRGQVYLDGGPCYFAERIDDNTRLTIDGEVYIENGGDCSSFVTTKRIDLPAGWHDFEVRFGNGGGGAGPFQAKSKEGFECGFGICRGEKAPSSMADCSYPVDPGDMTLFRYDDGTGFGSTLTIYLSPEGVKGPTEPMAGIEEGLAPGDKLTCSAPLTLVSGRRHYRLLGYLLAQIDGEGLVTSAVTNLGARTLEYVHGPSSASLTWLYENDGYLLDAAFLEGGDGSITLEPRPDLTGSCYTFGSVVAVTVEPAAGQFFSQWLGDLAEGSDPLSATQTVTMDRPRALRAACQGGWLYDAQAQTITDGNWVLFVSVSKEGKLSIGSVSSVLKPDALNLRAPVLDADGTLYPVVSIGGFSSRPIVNLLLPDTLETIGGSAFRDCEKLQSVSPFLPDSVVAIGSSAFQDCPELAGDLVLRNPAMKTLNANTFYGAKKLHSADLPHVESIAMQAFCSAASLETIRLSPGLTSIGASAFRDAASLTTVTPFLPDALTSIGINAFYKCVSLSGDLRLVNPAMKQVPTCAFGWCKGITSIDIPSVERIDAFGFEKIDALETVRLSTNLVAIGDYAFSHAPRLTTVTPFLPGSVTSIGKYAFYKAKMLGGDLVLSNPALTGLSDYAFGQAGELRSVSLPHVTSIGAYAFSTCPKLEEVLLCDKLESIGAHAFEQDGALATVSPFLPATLTSIGDYAFDTCKKLPSRLPLENPALSRFGGRVFRNDSSICEVWFSTNQIHFVDYDSFKNLAPGAALYFPGRAPAPDLQSWVFAHDNPGHQNVIYGSLRIDPDGWAFHAKPLTDADKALPDYPGPKTFGILVSGPTRNWLVDWRSPYEPKGTVLLLR